MKVKKKRIPEKAGVGPYHECPLDKYNWTHPTACWIHQTIRVHMCPDQCPYRKRVTTDETMH